MDRAVPRASSVAPRAIAGVAGLAILAAAAAGPGSADAAARSCPAADRPAAELGAATATAAARCVVDRERNALGLPALRVSSTLELAASRHAADMAARNYFAHDAPAPAPFGPTVGQRFSLAGYQWSSAGENIAVGQSTPRAVADAWLKSTGHCVNLLDPRLTDVGLAVDPRGTVGVPGPIWVQDLGRPLRTDPPAGAAPTCPRLPLDPGVLVAAIAPLVLTPEPTTDAGDSVDLEAAAEGTGHAEAEASGTAKTARAVATRASRRGRAVTVRLTGAPGTVVAARLRQKSWHGSRVRVRLGSTGAASRRLRARWATRGTVKVWGSGTVRTTRFR